MDHSLGVLIPNCTSTKDWMWENETSMFSGAGPWPFGCPLPWCACGGWLHFLQLTRSVRKCIQPRYLLGLWNRAINLNLWFLSGGYFRDSQWFCSTIHLLPTFTPVRYSSTMYLRLQEPASPTFTCTASRFISDSNNNENSTTVSVERQEHFLRNQFEQVVERTERFATKD